MQVFNEGYVNTAQFQLPLFQGPPKVHLLRALARDPARQCIVDNVVGDRVRAVKRERVKDTRERNILLTFEIEEKDAVIFRIVSPHKLGR